MTINWDLYGYVVSSKHRSNVLLALDVNKTPSQLGRELKISLALSSKTVRELEKKKLIRCLNRSAIKGRVYKWTTEGKEVADYLKKIKIKKD